MIINTNEKLCNLRKLMISNNIDTYIITKFDPHQSEYASEYWNGVKFISGFTGSNGTLVISKDKAGLWTDGRYYLQAESQLCNSIKLYKASEPTTKDFLSFAYDETPKGGTIGFDGRTISLGCINPLLNKITNKNIKLKYDIDILNTMWEDRHKVTRNKLFEFDKKYCGLTRIEKIALVREQIKKEDADIYIISSLDDIAWLFNIRCISDSNSFNFCSYAVITYDEVYLFIDTYRGDNETVLSLQSNNIKIKPYGEIFDYLENLVSVNNNYTVLISPNKTNYLLYSNIKGMLIKELDYDITSTFKAVKNNTEIKNLKIANKKDAVCLIRLLKWLKEVVKQKEVTEYDVSEKVLSLRQEMDNFKCLSFDTISGYNENGAIIHYNVTKENAKTLKNSGFLLLDSGGNYLEGTTDITRTISLGSLTEKMKEYYTLVLKAHISLSKLIFLYGSTGLNVDIIARAPLWEKGLNYQHGTGHGIGFFLNVHEGPQNIAFKNNTVVLEEGMVMSNEPGVYVRNEFGIRLENTVVVKRFNSTDHGEFMCFETISFVPFDIESIIPELLTDEERAWLNQYHLRVYENLETYLSEDERLWLKKITAKI